MLLKKHMEQLYIRKKLKDGSISSIFSSNIAINEHSSFGTDGSVCDGPETLTSYLNAV